MRERLEIPRKIQGTTGPKGLKKSLKTQISASFFRGFLLDFENEESIKRTGNYEAGSLESIIN